MREKSLCAWGGSGLCDSDLSDSQNCEVLFVSLAW